MMTDQINYIVAFWSRKFKSATEKKQQTFKNNITIVREAMKVGLWSPENQWEWFQDNWYIYGEHKEHTFYISQDNSECSCHSYQCSGEGFENKTPCKHLYALASGILTNW